MRKTTPAYKEMIYVLDNNWASKITGIGPRDSDKELLIQILQFAGCGLSVEQQAIIRRYNFESITRARRKLQQAGEYPPDSPEVARKRKLKSYEIEQTAPKETAGGLQRRIEQNEAVGY